MMDTNNKTQKQEEMQKKKKKNKTKSKIIIGIIIAPTVIAVAVAVYYILKKNNVFAKKETKNENKEFCNDKTLKEDTKIGNIDSNNNITGENVDLTQDTEKAVKMMQNGEKVENAWFDANADGIVNKGDKFFGTPKQCTDFAKNHSDTLKNENDLDFINTENGDVFLKYTDDGFQFYKNNQPVVGANFSFVSSTDKIPGTQIYNAENMKPIISNDAFELARSGSLSVDSNGDIMLKAASQNNESFAYMSGISHETYDKLKNVKELKKVDLEVKEVGYATISSNKPDHGIRIATAKGADARCAVFGGKDEYNAALRKVINNSAITNLWNTQEMKQLYS